MNGIYTSHTDEGFNGFNETKNAIVAVSYFGNDHKIYDALAQFAQIVGVQIANFNDQTTIGVLQFFSHGCKEGYVRAKFHQSFAQYFAQGQIELHLRNDSADILELIAAVASTTRGYVLGVVGAQGGIGTSSTSLWIGRELARKKFSVALVDLDPASVGIDLIFSGTNLIGKRWADFTGSGAMLADRLTQAIPFWHGIRVLSADARGGINMKTHTGAKAIAALTQINDCTVLDLPTSVFSRNCPEAQFLQWCDEILLLTSTNTVSLAQTQAKLSLYANLQGQAQRIMVGAIGAKSKNHLAHIATLLAPFQVYAIRRTRNYIADIEHGITPGDRRRSPTGRDIRAICTQLQIGSA